MMSFSRRPSRVPAACSPSRNVVSNTATRSDILLFSVPGGRSRLSSRLLLLRLSFARIQPCRPQNPPHFLGRNRKPLRHPGYLTPLPLPHPRNHDPRKLLRHLLERLPLDDARAPRPQQPLHRL